MNLTIQKLISSGVEIVLFSMIPFLWWLITAKKKQSFFAWIGLKPIGTARRRSVLLWMLALTVLFLLLSTFILYSVRNVPMAASEFSGLGISALPAILIYAVLNTSLPEEILFRGFLLKRLTPILGFHAGNLTQSLLFGIAHGAMFWRAVGIGRTVFIIIFTTSVAWCIGYIDERKADGSILPGWCIHAISNLLSGLGTAFAMLP
ncbi:CAAX protease self-immunity [Lachnospiraceae bacterium NK3A20]|nr:CAAX protease self-immunity [Lachnospiraceae bacterium NK3A20]